MFFKIMVFFFILCMIVLLIFVMEGNNGFCVDSVGDYFYWVIFKLLIKK